ncbi:MAG: molybdopterin-dependent oxidoreductase [Rubellimicrobium sp.]|nr:molybdopterin-dependent oxidoreductase [Rubellimicrobium sp.]
MPAEPATFTLSHWGVHEVQGATGNELRLTPWADDPDPGTIGLDLGSPAVDALRVRKPSFRQGWLAERALSRARRGQEAFVELPWSEAVGIVAEELARVIRERGNAAIYGGSYGWASAGRFHHAQSHLHRFLNTIGGHVQSRDSYSHGAGSVIMPRIVGPMDELLAEHTDWGTLAEATDLFVAFGGLPLRNTRMSGGGAGRHMVRAALDRMRARGTRLVNISPIRQDIDGAADWIPIRPGTDAALILALIHVLISEGLHDRGFLQSHCVGFDQVRNQVLGLSEGPARTPQWAEAITGVPAGTTVELARRMAAGRTLVNASWSLQRQSHGEQNYWAVVTLAAVLGQIGLPGGGFGLGYGCLNSIGNDAGTASGLRVPQGSNPVRDFIPVARLSDMLLNPGASFRYDGGTHRYPAIALVYWAGGNPFHHHQDLHRLIAAWTRPETIVVHEQYWTATAKAADIVLPASTTLERDDIGYAPGEGQLVAMRRVRHPVGEARSDFEIFAALAGAMGQAAAYTDGRDAGQWLRHMYAAFRASAPALAALPDFARFWQAGRLDLPLPRRPRVLLGAFRADPDAAPLPTPSGKVELHAASIAGLALADCPGQASWLEPAEWLGAPAAATWPIHLLSQEPRNRLHSQLDHGAASQAGKIKGREPLLMNAGDARTRGIADGDLVRVFNARGAFLAAARLGADILPGVAAIATGAWFDPVTWDPANPLERHGNPNVVTLDAGASEFTQATVAQSCLVQVERFREAAPAIRAFDLPDFVAQDSRTRPSPHDGA